MEALGINISYLAAQVFCMFVVPLLIIGSIVYWLIKRKVLKQDDLVATITVTEEGVVIPKKLLPTAENLEIYQQNDKIILVPKSE